MKDELIRVARYLLTASAIRTLEKTDSVSSEMSQSRFIFQLMEKPIIIVEATSNISVIYFSFFCVRRVLHDIHEAIIIVEPTSL